MASRDDTDTLVPNEELPEPTQIPSVAAVTVDVTGDGDATSGDNAITNGTVTKGNSQQQIRQNIIDLSNNGGERSGTNGQLEKVRYETIPVCYSSMYGVYVVRKPIVRTLDDGTHVIATPYAGDAGMEERPLRPKDIRFVKIASIVTLIIFFPLGIPAFWYALKAEEDFAKVNDDEQYMETAKKKVRKSERLVLFGIVVGVLLYIMIIAIVQRNKAGWHESRPNLHWVH